MHIFKFGLSRVVRLRDQFLVVSMRILGDPRVLSAVRCALRG